MPRHSDDEAVELIDALRQRDGALIRRMAAIQAHYNGAIVAPTPLLTDHDHDPADIAGPMLIADAIDRNSQKASSLQPIIQCQFPPGSTGGTDAKNRLHRREVMLSGTWTESGAWDSLIGRGYRHYFGYASTAFETVRDSHVHQARVRLRNPLAMYPEPREPEDYTPLNYCGYIHKKSASSILKLWGHLPSVSDNIQAVSARRTEEMWDILDFQDEYERKMILLGPCRAWDYQDSNYEYMSGAGHKVRTVTRLSAEVNLADQVTVAVLRRVTLDRIESSVMKLTPQVNWIHRLQKLEAIAAEKGVFPMFIVFGDRDEPPIVVGGEMKDGRDGEPTLVHGARGVQQVQMAPSLVSQAVADRMIGAFGQSGGLDPLSVGEARGASLRTGNALTTMAGFSLDPIIAEAHRTMARQMQLTNEHIAAVNKGYYKNSKMFYFSGRPGDRKMQEVVPSRDLDSTTSLVYYPLPGADISTITVAIGQLVQTELSSVSTGRALHPLIFDPDHEENQRAVEILDKVLLQAVSTRATQPELGPVDLLDLAEISKQIQRGKSPTEAIESVYKKATERAAQAQAQAPTPVLPPGGGGAGGGVPPAPPGPAAVEPPTDAGDRLRRVVTNLNARTSAAGAGVQAR